MNSANESQDDQPYKPDAKSVIFICCILVMILLFALTISLVVKNHEVTAKYNDLVLELRSCKKYYVSPIQDYIPFVEEKEDNESARNFSNV